MEVLSKWFETNLIERVVEILERYFDKRFELERNQRTCGLVSRKKLMDDLGIGTTTLNQWESAGLKRYQPPFERASKIYYKETDIERFLSM